MADSFKEKSLNHGATLQHLLPICDHTKEITYCYLTKLEPKWLLLPKEV